MPAVDLSDFVKPVPVSKANTTFSLHGHAGACEAFSFDLAADIQPRLLINAESIQYTDRMMTGEATMEAVSLATINWFDRALNHTTGAMAAQHGTAAGNIVAFGAPRCRSAGRPMRKTRRSSITSCRSCTCRALVTTNSPSP